MFLGSPCRLVGDEQDLVLPSFKHPGLIGASPLLGFPPRPRTFLACFQGNVGLHRLPHYSRGIRQRLYRASMQHHWHERHGIVIAEHAPGPTEYAELLSSSTFCLVVPGDGFSTRAEDAILHGCVPVIIMDDVDPVFSTILDWPGFSVRIKEVRNCLCARIAASECPGLRHLSEQP